LIARGAENLLKTFHKKFGGEIITSVFRPELTYSYFRKNNDKITTVVDDEDYIKSTSISNFNQESLRPGYTDLKLFNDNIDDLKERFRNKINEAEYDEEVTYIPFDILAAYFLPKEKRGKAYLHCTFRIFTDLEHITKSTLSSDAIEVFEEIKKSTGKEIEEAVQDYESIACNSKYVSETFDKYYGVDAKVIYPGVDTSRFKRDSGYDDYWLSVQRLEDYKRVDLQLKAFSTMPDEKLVVVGTGAQADYVDRAASKLPNVEYLGEVENSKLHDLYSNAKGTIQSCQIEDFGLVPVESMACGTPVLAADKGGFKETVKENAGVRFDLNADSLRQAVKKFDRSNYNEKVLREHAKNYSKTKMFNQFEEFLDE